MREDDAASGENVYMRTVLALLALAAPVLAQDAPRKAVVRADSAELRSGPSDAGKFPVTNRVPRGAALEVVGEATTPGWLRVTPPAGSHSWICTRFLKDPVPGKETFVSIPQGDTAPSFPGSSVDFVTPPEQVGARLSAGTVVRCLAGAPVAGPDGMLIRIEPPAKEVRYVRASALDGAAAAGTFTPTPTPAPGATTSAGPAGSLPPAKHPSANGPQTAEQLWQQAYQAHVNRRYEDAAQLYSDAADAAKSNPQLAAAATEQARVLRAWLASVSSAPSYSPGRAAEGRPTPVGNYKGRLRSAGWLGGQRAYSLEVEVRGGLRQVAGFYVTAGPGVDLTAQVGREVELSGTPVYRGEYRSYVLVAARARAAP
jgi:hypothetical protein